MLLVAILVKEWFVSITFTSIKKYPIFLFNIKFDFPFSSLRLRNLAVTSKRINYRCKGLRRIIGQRIHLKINTFRDNRTFNSFFRKILWLVNFLGAYTLNPECTSTNSFTIPSFCSTNREYHLKGIWSVTFVT